MSFTRSPQNREQHLTGTTLPTGGQSPGREPLVQFGKWSLLVAAVLGAVAIYAVLLVTVWNLLMLAAGLEVSTP